MLIATGSSLGSSHSSLDPEAKSKAGIFYALIGGVLLWWIGGFAKASVSDQQQTPAARTTQKIKNAHGRPQKIQKDISLTPTAVRPTPTSCIPTRSDWSTMVLRRVNACWLVEGPPDEIMD